MNISCSTNKGWKVNKKRVYKLLQGTRARGSFIQQDCLVTFLLTLITELDTIHVGLFIGLRRRYNSSNMMRPWLNLNEALFRESSNFNNDFLIDLLH